jgi:hypothetical protein
MTPAEVAALTAMVADLNERMEILEALMGVDEKRRLVGILETMHGTDDLLADAVEDVQDRLDKLEVAR